jgi:hypothetical protein
MEITEERQKLIKIIADEVKLGVVYIDIAMTVYVLWLLLTNYSSWLPEVVLGFTPLGVTLILRASQLFHLCWCHKLMLFHSCAVHICCVFQANYGFGIFLYPLRWTMFISGSILIVLIIRQYFIYKKTHKHKQKTLNS